MTLGQRIRDCRLKANMTQEQVAEKLSVSRQAVTKWESGQSAPSTEKLFRLAELFGTTVDFLLTQPDEAPPPLPDAPQADAEAPEAVITGWVNKMKNRICAAAFVGLGYYLFFLIYKSLYCDVGMEYGLFYFLFEAHHSHLPYLFGWLLSSHLYPVCAIVSMCCALLGNPWAALLTCLAFPAGIFLGEAFGKLGLSQWALENGYHNGWAIWLCIYFGALLLGNVIQIIPGIRRRHRAEKKTPN